MEMNWGEELGFLRPIRFSYHTHSNEGGKYSSDILSKKLYQGRIAHPQMRLPCNHVSVAFELAAEALNAIHPCCRCIQSIFELLKSGSNG